MFKTIKKYELIELTEEEKLATVGGDKFWRDIANFVGYMYEAIANMPNINHDHWPDEIGKVE